MENICYYPDLPRIANITDLEMSYRQESDVWTPYFGHKTPIREPFAKKTKFAAAFISNCGAKNNRLEVLKELMKHLPRIDSFGRCLHNTGSANGKKLELLQPYKFTFAFENCNTKDYVTEKMYAALRCGSVPVYMGAPNIEDFSHQIPSSKFPTFGMSNPWRSIWKNSI